MDNSVDIFLCLVYETYGLYVPKNLLDFLKLCQSVYFTDKITFAAPKASKGETHEN